MPLQRLRGQFVAITYRASFWDVPARPLFRFLSADGILSEVIGSAPFEASAVWTGRIPSRTTRLHVSPTNVLGLFNFRVEAIRRRSWRRLLAEGLGRAPRQTRSALLTRLIGWRPEADNNLAWAIGAYRLGDYRRWSRRRRRALEIEALDRPRCAWNDADPIRVVVRAEQSDPASLERTLDSLRGQILPRWTALVVGAPARDDDPRIVCVDSDAVALKVATAHPLWCGVISAGEVLRAEALATIVERRCRDSDAALFYGDEVVEGRPLLKPGWSPRLAAALPYLGDAVFASPAACPPAMLARLLRGGDWHMLDGRTPVAIRRPLLSRVDSSAERTPKPSAGSVKVDPSAAPRTAIVVLTRNQPALLTRLVASIRNRSAPGSFHLVIVDNGDADGSATAVLADLATAADVTVLPRRGPFNFSALCNEAAATTGNEVLLFLNDDMEVRSDDWLARLARHALEPGVGAVGARLTYPDGRLQHIGVLAGMGGSAGHFGALGPGDDPGWARRNEVLHEVSAVTGACLAVERRKFEAVGGFDAEHLPVELSDIDLCFKLNAQGWQTLVDPVVHLMHEESFSRGGATLRRLSKYGDQRAVFVERWRHVLRDDPVFHPALSLYSWQAALG